MWILKILGCWKWKKNCEMNVYLWTLCNLIDFVCATNIISTFMWFIWKVYLKWRVLLTIFRYFNCLTYRRLDNIIQFTLFHIFLELLELFLRDFFTALPLRGNWVACALKSFIIWCRYSCSSRRYRHMDIFWLSNLNARWYKKNCRGRQTFHTKWHTTYDRFKNSGSHREN
jgi:hypothetical protein